MNFGKRGHRAGRSLSFLIMSGHIVRTYERWQGNNLFLCGGRLIFGSSYLCFFASLFLLASTGILFLISIASIEYRVIGGLLWVLSIIFLLKTAASDPGIIPRNLSASKPDPPADFQVGPDGPSHRFCDTCNIWRPPRAKHCRYCNNCVRCFDHHCAWMGTCIGERNYRSFVFFVCSTMTLTVFVLGVCVFEMLKMKDSDPTWVRDFISSKPFIPVIMTVAGFSVLGLISLFIYHCSLILMGQTTNEHIRDVYRDRENPYDQGRWKNFIGAICHAATPSQLQLREPVVSDESSFSANESASV